MAGMLRDTKQYWQEVRQDASSETLRALGLRSSGQVMLKVAPVMFGVVALVYAGTSGAAQDQLVTIAAVIIVYVAIMPLMYFYKLIEIPARRELNSNLDKKELADENDELRAHLNPKLRIAFDPNDAACSWIDTIVNDATGEIDIKAIHYCVRIDNLSNTAVHNVKAKLMDFRDYSSSVLPQVLQPKNDVSATFTLSPHETSYVHVLSIDFTGVIPQIVLRYLNKTVPNTLHPRFYGMKIKVYADNTLPVNGLFSVYPNDKGNFQFGPLKIKDR